jgi:hypothetical protein
MLLSKLLTSSTTNALILAMTISDVWFIDLHKGKLDSNKHNNLSWSEKQMHNFSHLSLLCLIAHMGSKDSNTPNRPNNVKISLTD